MGVCGRDGGTGWRGAIEGGDNGGADGDEELAEAILDGRIKVQGLGRLASEDKTPERVAELRRRLDPDRAEFKRRYGL